jgi:hypothetical protein
MGGSQRRNGTVGRKYGSSEAQTSSQCGWQTGNNRRHEETLGPEAGRRHKEATSRVEEGLGQEGEGGVKAEAGKQKGGSCLDATHRAALATAVRGVADVAVRLPAPRHECPRYIG